MTDRPKLSKAVPVTMEDMEKGLRINEHALQEDCQRQPIMFYEVAKRFAMAQAEYDAAKKRLAEIESEVATEIRHSSTDKLTEGRLKELVTVYGVVRKQSDRVLELKAALGQWSALKEAFESRKYMLKEMVSLYLNNYYSDPLRGTESKKMGDVTVDRYLAARRRDNETDRRV